MMAGEIEYENFIYENGEALYPFTGHTMILIFTVLVSIILMNLLVGLAVSDIQVIVKGLIRCRPKMTSQNFRSFLTPCHPPLSRFLVLRLKHCL